MWNRLARMHSLGSSPSPARVSSLVVGWLIAAAGCAILLGELFSLIARSQTQFSSAVSGGLMAALATALGAVPVLVTRRISENIQDMLLGLGAGVMLAASVFSLLLPGITAATALGISTSQASVLVGIALCLGAGMLLVLDRLLPHQHTPNRQRSATAVWLFVFAIAVHNIPEGLAIGVAASASSGNAVATGISVQNVPEGLIVAIALVTAGYRRMFAAAIAAVSGLVEPVAAMVGSVMVQQSVWLLPWGLGAAAGAMLFVVSHEIIPESHRRGHETLATTGLIIGFIAMLLMDTALA